MKNLSIKRGNHPYILSTTVLSDIIVHIMSIRVALLLEVK